jgi:hypothetical protein
VRSERFGLAPLRQASPVKLAGPALKRPAGGSSVKTSFPIDFSRHSLALGEQPPLRIIEDMGRVSGGVSNGRHVRAENGSEYLLKGRILSPNMPYVAANELLTARLARQLDLPILAHDVAEYKDNLCFASAWMASGSYESVSSANLARVANRERLFDIWIANTDRHEGNLLVRRAAAGAELLLLNDHSHVLAGASGGALASSLAAAEKYEVNWCLRSSLVEAEIRRDPAAMRKAAEAIEALPAEQIRALASSLPRRLLEEEEATLYANFLLARREALSGLLHKAGLIR